MTREEAAASQDWARLSGVEAWMLINRHADCWEDVGAMMDAWLEARAPAVNPDVKEQGKCTSAETAGTVGKSEIS